MITPIISVDKAILELKDKFKGLSEEQTHQAIARAINRTLTQGLTIVKKNVVGKFNLEPGDLKSSLSTWNANKNSLMGYITASSKPQSLTHFKPLFTYTSAGATAQLSIRRTKGQGKGKYNFLKKKNRKIIDAVPGLSIEVFKGVRKIVPHAFMSTGSQNSVFERGAYKVGGAYGFMYRNKRVTTGKDLPIAKLVTISVSGQMMNEDVEKANSVDITDAFKKRLETEINFIMGKIK